MRIAHIILPDASAYECKAQRVDQAALAERHEIVVVPTDEVKPDIADLAHVYAGEKLPASAFMRLAMPYVATAELSRSRWSLRKPRGPAIVVTPENLPEAVEERYFAATRQKGSRAEGETRIVGSFARPPVRNLVEQTLARIHRFRDDVTWKTFEAPPSPEDLAGVDLWVDPAVESGDYSGFVAEALVVGTAVVAGRTPLNARRLEQGRIGTLVPLRDPNELTHAILASLFKPGVADSKISAARQTVAKFRARHRIRVLLDMYETLNG